MQVEHVVSQQLPRLIDNGNLASSPQSRIDAEHCYGTGRRSKQQVIEIVAENLNGFGIGPLLQLETNFALNGRIQEPLPCIIDGEFKLRCPIALLAQNMLLHDGHRSFRFDFDQEVEHALALTATDSQ